MIDFGNDTDTEKNDKFPIDKRVLYLLEKDKKRVSDPVVVAERLGLKKVNEGDANCKTYYKITDLRVSGSVVQKCKIFYEWNKDESAFIGEYAEPCDGTQILEIGGTRQG